MYLEICTYILLSLAVSTVLFLIIMIVGGKLVDAVYSGRKSVVQKNEHYIEELQVYIKANNISSENIYMLDNWVEDNKQIYISLKVNGKWLYFSDGREGEQYDVNYEMSMLPESGNYIVELKDGYGRGSYSGNVFI